MLKFKGTSFPVSTAKILLHDKVWERLDFVKKQLKVKTTNEALTVMVNHTYELMKQLEKYDQKEINLDDNSPTNI